MVFAICALGCYTSIAIKLKEGMPLKIVLLSKEYPPHIYGGAGVHVDYLSRALCDLDGGKHTVNVMCFGDQHHRDKNLTVCGIDPACELPVWNERHRSIFDMLLRDVFMAGSVPSADILRCHTWYTLLAGCIIKQILRVPLLVTAHSLEPLRPWKQDQLGNGYHMSKWLEKTAFENADGLIAVSESMKRDIHRIYGVPSKKITIIYNGIDDKIYRPKPNPKVVSSYGIDLGKPYVLLVCRITRQKGITHFLNMIKHLKPDVQAVICADAPDTDELKHEVSEKIGQFKSKPVNRVLWIAQNVPREHLISLYTHAAVFVCPSIYEPFGLINLEAMACETPVVASAVGGIPEVVQDGRTGLLVPFRPRCSKDPEPKKPEQFAGDLAKAVNRLISDPSTSKIMGRRARKRVEEHFSWKVIAQKTMNFYEHLRHNYP